MSKWLKYQIRYAEGLGPAEYVRAWDDLNEQKLEIIAAESDGIRQPHFELVDKPPTHVLESKLREATQREQAYREERQLLIQELDFKVIFLAMPTAGVALPDSAQTGRLAPFVYEVMAKLHERYSSYTFVAPMVQDYLLLKHLSVKPVWDVWGERCKRLIERSDEVWVLKFNGYATSVGVLGEINHADLVKVPVRFLDVDTLAW